MFRSNLLSQSKLAAGMAVVVKSGPTLTENQVRDFKISLIHFQAPEIN